MHCTEAPGGTSAAANVEVPVLTSDEWSQDMARAIFLPRFIPEEEGCVPANAREMGRFHMGFGENMGIIDDYTII